MGWSIKDWSRSISRFVFGDNKPVITGVLSSDANKRLLELEKKVEVLEDMMQNKVEPNLFNREVLTNLILLLTVLVIILAVSVFYLYTHLPRSESQGGNNNVQDARILKQVPINPQMKDDVCLISFCDRFKTFNKSLVAHIPAEVTEYVIRSHADIPSIPPAVVTIMCVEFTERHVIIEEEGIGQGNIRSLTVEAIKKLGSTLIILYTHDPGSRDLSHLQTYNKEIYCVTSRPDLQTLNRTGRFFSVKDRLTDYQQRCLTDVIRRALSQ